MNREYDPTKPYNPANKVFIFFLVILIAVSIAWYMVKKADFDFENMWNQIVEDFTSEETTPTNYDYDYNYSYDNNLPSSLDEIFSNHTNELVDLANFELDFNTNFQDLDLSNNGVNIKASCKYYNNKCYYYTIDVEGVNATIYSTTEKIDHLYYMNGKLFIGTEEDNTITMKAYNNGDYDLYLYASKTLPNGKDVSPIMYDNKLYFVYSYSNEAYVDSSGRVYVYFIDLTSDELEQTYLGSYSQEG